MVVKMVVRPIAKLSEGFSTILGSNKAADAVPRRCIEEHLRRDQVRGSRVRWIKVVGALATPGTDRSTNQPRLSREEDAPA